MNCPKCKKEVTPLVLRNGLVCSDCLKPFVDRGKACAFCITKDNDEAFHLSEAAFFRGIKEENSRYVNLAFELCKKACDGYRDASGESVHNPEAYVRMGYYYEKDLIPGTDGKDAGLEKSYRIMIAYEYYSLVCNGTLVPGDLDVHKAFTEIQKEAADRLLRVLADFPDGERRNPRYSLERNREELVGKGLVSSANVFSEAGAHDVVTALEKDLGEMFRGRTNILFSAYRIPASELIRLIPADEKTRNASCLYRAMDSNKIKFYYFEDTKGQDTISQAIFSKHHFEEFVKDATRETSDSERFFVLMFLNGNYHASRLNEKDLGKVESQLILDCTGIDSILSDLKKDTLRVFEDDVFFCKKRGGQLGASFAQYIKEDPDGKE